MMRIGLKKKKKLRILHLTIGLKLKPDPEDLVLKVQDILKICLVEIGLDISNILMSNS